MRNEKRIVAHSLTQQQPAMRRSVLIFVLVGKEPATKTVKATATKVTRGEEVGGVLAGWLAGLWIRLRPFSGSSNVSQFAVALYDCFVLLCLKWLVQLVNAIRTVPSRCLGIVILGINAH